ncbi:MAG: D-alanyl-D-alanine carboxypeptidase family protein [Bacillota bacterium]
MEKIILILTIDVLLVSYGITAGAHIKLFYQTSAVRSPVYALEKDEPSNPAQINRPAKPGPPKKSGGPVLQGLLLVNKERGLPADYAPSDLVNPDIAFIPGRDWQDRLMRREAAAAVERLFDAARGEKIELYGVSAYRSYRKQSGIFTRNAKLMGEREANRLSARPGQSEHQTGLAIDISSPGMGGLLSAEFGNTREGLWLQENAPRFGFIIRYPRGKESVTGYRYEPWHIRYVGVRHAEAISRSGQTLEEYL